MNEKSITVEILPDGRVKVETGDLSGPQHMKADQFLREMARLLGGDVTVEKLNHHHHHHHHHNHNHNKRKN
ncbi:MAG TPA: hypothetical protein VNQ79_05430 [Blastocatellia bacterium]|jgi:hypothetical protein|nr:hypothetical protein [Blastocatellia bacterium]